VFEIKRRIKSLVIDPLILKDLILIFIVPQIFTKHFREVGCRFVTYTL